MRLDSMKPVPGSRRKRKRRGRGPGSGLGKTAGRGHKGFGARAGSKVGVGFEGGQMPLARRLPKHGFKNPFRVAYQVINLEELLRFEDGAVVDIAALKEAGLVKRKLPVKILGRGKLDRKLVVTANAFSVVARDAITAAGGSAQVEALKPAGEGEKD